MDYSPMIRRAIRLIAEAIDKYAKNQGWSIDDYRWYYRVSPEWGHIHIILVANAFKGRDYSEAYRSVRDFLYQELRDEPALFQSIGIVLRDFDQVNQGGIYEIGPDYEDFWAFRPVRETSS
jgi:hypothetical protein